jgi:hypothetical protein
MALAIVSDVEHALAGDRGGVRAAADPLEFLAGRRYTCYCGRSVVGSILCPDCAEEMTDYFRSAAGLRLAESKTQA